MEKISFYKKLACLLCLIVVFGIFYSYRVTSRSVDFDINYKAGCLVREDKIEYVLTDEFPHKFPPIIGMYFSLYCKAGHDFGRILFFWISLAAIVTSLILGMKITNNESIFFGFFLPLLLILRSVLWEFDLGNSNHLILLGLMLSLYFYTKGKTFLSSLFLVFAAIMKLFPGLLFLYFLIKKQYKYLLYSLISFVLLVFVIPLVFYGYTDTVQRLILWSKALFGNPLWTVYDHANQSLLGMVSRLLIDTPYKINFITLSINHMYVIYAVLFLSSISALSLYIYKSKNEFSAIAMTIAVSVFLSPLCWIQTFLVSAFMLQLIGSQLRLIKYKPHIYLILIGWILTQVTNPEILGNKLEDLVLAYSAMTVGWLIYMFVLQHQGRQDFQNLISKQ